MFSFIGKEPSKILTWYLRANSWKKTTAGWFDSKEIFSEVYKLNNKFGINSTSIAEITNIPRTTILRKLVKLEKV